MIIANDMFLSDTILYLFKISFIFTPLEKEVSMDNPHPSLSHPSLSHPSFNRSLSRAWNEFYKNDLKISHNFKFKK